MNEIEDAFVTESRKQGFQPVRSAMTRLAEYYAGSKLDNGTIILPSKLSISVKNAVASMREQTPNLFLPIADDQPSAEDQTNAEDQTGSTLTEWMTAEVRKLRARQMPSDWHAVRSRMTGRTAEMMDEVAAARLAR